VDAIPDIGENQQIVFTRWPGRSPQDVEDQLTYPLSANLLGLPGVKTVRAYSMFGFSTIYVIFEEQVEFYWSRSRLLEKLASLPPGLLPEDATPVLGPDATALGQVFWYTLQGADAEGNPTGGWDLAELRSIQDWNVRLALMSVEGVSEVASVGGFVQEIQVDVDPDAMRARSVSLADVMHALKMAGAETGAGSIEINRVEYVVRGVGFVRELGDVEEAVIRSEGGTPVRIRDVARVVLGPAPRRGALDVGGAEAVGGVVVVRYGENPLAAIQAVKRKIAEISPGLPRKTLPDGVESQVRIVPFYDRTQLIHETLSTLNDALVGEILVTLIVVLLMVRHLRSSLLIAGLLPAAVLICFIAMKLGGVEANIVALSGIAIAIGTMVDMGIVVSENILRHLAEDAGGGKPRGRVLKATREVAGAVLTALATTVVSFLPVFTLEAAEGKLFRPLAYTKTFALVAALLLALAVIPPLAEFLFTRRLRRGGVLGLGLLLATAGTWLLFGAYPAAGLLVLLAGLVKLAEPWLPGALEPWRRKLDLALVVLLAAYWLAEHWLPLGGDRPFALNLALVALLIFGLLAFYRLVLRSYDGLLDWCLSHKTVFLALPLSMLVLGGLIWSRTGDEFMPPLDEGSYLFMPSTMPHASMSEVQEVLQYQDASILNIPEVSQVVGKLGRAETPLDPAPLSMIETVINYLPEYLQGAEGGPRRFRFDPDSVDLVRDAEGRPLSAPDGEPYRSRGAYPRDSEGRLIPDAGGRYFRNWRAALDPGLNRGRAAWEGIQRPDDIWSEIVRAGEIPGTTSAPKLQPISTRLVMLQSGMRAPMGIKIKGPDLKSIESAALKIEELLREIPSVNRLAVVADRVVGKPYLELHVDRERIARYGISMGAVQEVIAAAVGGRTLAHSVEGRERYAVRVRYQREERDNLEALRRIYVPAPDGRRVPLEQLAELRYQRGPQMIKSEDNFLLGYVLFDGREGLAEVQVVEEARLEIERRLAEGELVLPSGVSLSFAGTYENQLRAARKLLVVIPLALAIILVLLFLQFRSLGTTVLVFSGVAVAWAGGFLLIWLYGQPWFLDFEIFGAQFRELFQVHPVHLSVAVWVGFLALFGIATDDGVIMATYLDQSFRSRRPGSPHEIREAVKEAGGRRVRPCLMTTATTVLALLPVLSSQGRGADVMVPMAIPVFGGMLVEVVTMFTVPVLYSAAKEWRLRSRSPGPDRDVRDADSLIAESRP